MKMSSNSQERDLSQLQKIKKECLTWLYLLHTQERKQNPYQKAAILDFRFLWDFQLENLPAPNTCLCKAWFLARKFKFCSLPIKTPSGRGVKRAKSNKENLQFCSKRKLGTSMKSVINVQNFVPGMLIRR